ncbi:sulfurtransferase [Pseudohalioglobus lutimaris]|uniref:Sulfurtransferase n=1 Tax=Pseudohalioglobus lutimaris TaxID=1737061 RepID=A0A2N5X716_9GAMM|nr:sulfurtransferase [Pseudohalioglobus lutimaris]PLW70286.1 sulfurtransferase [Pseudohalioglobus lutimaris]
MLIEAEALDAAQDAVIVDCRFSLADADEGRRLYAAGHIPGAFYLDLNLELSSPVQKHGGRHPLPESGALQARLAQCGIGPDTEVIAYDASRFAFASRLWWLMRSLGYRPPRLLNGGYAAWLACDGVTETRTPALRDSAYPPRKFSGYCDIGDLTELQASGALLVDSRETPRYQGVDEPIDPVAGHIPGAVNHPWQGVTDEAGRYSGPAAQREHWGDSLNSAQMVVYCGSGVTACVNLFSLSLMGRENDILYAGSWSDWCSYL